MLTKLEKFIKAENKMYFSYVYVQQCTPITYYDTTDVPKCFVYEPPTNKEGRIQGWTTGRRTIELCLRSRLTYSKSVHANVFIPYTMCKKINFTFYYIKFGSSKCKWLVHDDDKFTDLCLSIENFEIWDGKITEWVRVGSKK